MEANDDVQNNGDMEPAVHEEAIEEPVADEEVPVAPEHATPEPYAEDNHEGNPTSAEMIDGGPVDSGEPVSEAKDIAEGPSEMQASEQPLQSDPNTQTSDEQADTQQQAEEHGHAESDEHDEEDVEEHVADEAASEINSQTTHDALYEKEQDAPGLLLQSTELMQLGTGTLLAFDDEPASPAGGPRGAYSAPVSPMGTRRLPRRTIHLTHKSQDAMTLAQSIIQERKEQEQLQAILAEKEQQATQRRHALSPEPRTTATTPVSLVIKTYPGWVPHPQGWKNEWSTTSHYEVGACDRQLAASLDQALRDDQTRFQWEMAMRAEEAKQEAKRLEAEQQRHNQRAATKDGHEQHVLESGRTLYSRRLSTMEQRQAVKEDKSSAFLGSVRGQRQAAAQHHHQDLDTRVQAALERQATYDSMRASSVMSDHRSRIQRRDESSQRKHTRDTINCEMHTETSQRRIGNALGRANQLNNQRDNYMQLKQQKQQDAIAAAEWRHQQALAARAQGIASRRGQRFARVQARAEVLEYAQEVKASRVHNRHAALSSQLAQRRAEETAADVQYQKHQTGRMLMDHWAREMELQASIQNKIPALRPDVQQTLTRVKGSR